MRGNIAVTEDVNELVDLDENDLVDTNEGAKILDIAPVTLKTSRSTGKLGDRPAPEYYKIGKNVRYSREYLKKEFLDACLVVPEPVAVTAL